MEPIHFYHVYADGYWHEPVAYHFNALREARFEGNVQLGLVGKREAREAVKDYVQGEWPDFGVCAQAEAGFEEITLNQVRIQSKVLNPDNPVLYAHAKGSYHNTYAVNENTGKVLHETGLNAVQRDFFTSRLIYPWRSRVAELRGRDAVGIAWITPENEPIATYEHFHGNFWWANAGYLATLPELPALVTRTRTDAEAWLGLNKPRIKKERDGYDWVPVLGYSLDVSSYAIINAVSPAEAERKYAAGDIS